jgi:tetratricopeptide (TPR) repeat protein
VLGRATAIVLGAMCASAESSPSPSPDGDDAPYVEILQSGGAIDGPSEGGVSLPTWERVRLDLHVKNRLGVEVRDLEVEVALVSTSGTGETTAQVIPGWSFKEVFSEQPVPAYEEAFLRITRELPSRRTMPRADEIAYRARIKSYRLSPPDLDTAIRLLGSSHESDQMAALKSYEVQPEMDKEAVTELGQKLARAIGDLPDEPAAPDALRMLFAVRALGTLADTSEVRMLLEVPGSRDGRAYAQAIVDLAKRMLNATESSEPDRPYGAGQEAPREPRFRVLPGWAREKTTISFPPEDALEDAVRDAILRMGDAAVPALLGEAHMGSVPGVRARAERLLHALGRATVRSQLSVRDRDAKLEVIGKLGQIGAPDAVPALAELLRGHDRELREAAAEAIAHIGPPAVDPLVASVGTPDDEALLSALRKMLPRSNESLFKAAARYGVARQQGEDAAKLLDRLRAHLFTAQRARLVQEIDRALDLAREGSYTEAFQRLDRVFTQDPALYMQHARPIAEMYVARGRRLYQRGDYDAAISTLRIGQSIQKVEEADKLLMSAELALARGFLELGDLERAEETLHEADPSLADQEMRSLEAKLLALRATQALANGDYGKARTLIDRARALKLRAPELSVVSRRVMIAENLAIIIVLALFFPALVLVVVVAFRRRREAARIERLQAAIDRAAL